MLRTTKSVALHFVIATVAAAALSNVALVSNARRSSPRFTRSLMSSADEAAAEGQPVPFSVRSRLEDALNRRWAEEKDRSTMEAQLGATGVSLPMQDATGIYHIKTKEQHTAFLKANPDKLVVMKFTAAYCRACAAISQKFGSLVKDEKLADLPIVWADFQSSGSTKAFFRRLGVLSLPTVHFYDGSNGLVENFPCGPTMFPTLLQKLSQFLNSRVDPTTRRLKELPRVWSSDQPRKVREILIGDELVTNEHIEFLRDGMPFFEDLTDAEFDGMLAKATLETFLPGDVVIRQGMPPRNFYVVKSGVLEMCIRSRFADPISTPPSYLGAVVNQMGMFDYFGERALTTGEPYAASVRALEKSRCFAFKVEDIPESSILSKKRKANREMVERLSARYELPQGYTPAYFPTAKDESILELLVRFKQIRQVAKCFEYVMNSEPLLGNTNEIARRSMLVSKLSKSQRQDFVEAFNIIDEHRKGTISLLDMRRLMDRARTQRSDAELREMIEKANPRVKGLTYGASITLDEFMGVMAEAEIYSLFTETFQALDKDNTGYVRAGDLDEVLGGVRDLINDDRKSIIDVEDQDVQIDYEQFARMLLGAAL